MDPHGLRLNEWRFSRRPIVEGRRPGNRFNKNSCVLRKNTGAQPQQQRGNPKLHVLTRVLHPPADFIVRHLRRVPLWEAELPCAQADSAGTKSYASSNRSSVLSCVAKIGL